MNSDGDAPPDEVVAWYEAHGYDFLALSDHNVLTPPCVSRPTSLTLLPAEEITMALSVHVNGLGLTECITPPDLPPDEPKPKTWLIEQAIAAVEAQGGLAHVNHPNWQWALCDEDLAAARSMRFLELFNGHPDANNQGVEAKWDRLLTHGRRVYALATDDAHHYGTFEPFLCNPGRGWIYVRAADPRPESILDAMHAGQFYASTGVELANYAVRGRELTVSCRSGRGQGEGPLAIELFGPGGKLIEAETASEARFHIPETEPYARVRVTAAGGQRAWLQPAWV